MKPKYGKVLELATVSDFSKAALDNAMDLIWDEVAPDGGTTKKLSYYLSIGVEGDILHAMDLARVYGLGFNLCQTFTADEWQIEVFVVDGGKLDVIKFWCPGA